MEAKALETLKWNKEASVMEREVLLNNGVKIPVIGLGVYKVTDPGEIEVAVESALEAGYRAFDTAQMYRNEQMLGQSLKNAGIPREEIFLTSKVDLGNMGYQKTLDTFQESLEKLQTDYLDLFLIHWPGQDKERVLETWKAMEELYQKKRIRALGLSNFNPRHLEWVLESASVKPVLNQVEHHLQFQNTQLALWCQERGIRMQAWSPLMRGNLTQPQLLALAKKYGKTPAQIVLRWDLQNGYLVIPKSVHRERIFENIDIFDVELEPEDMALLNSLHTGQRISHDPEVFDF